MATFKQNLKKVATARSQLGKAESGLYSAKLKVQREKNPASLAEVRSELAATQNKVNLARERLQDVITGLWEGPKYTDIAAELDAKLPVVFLPVRIETRLVTVRNKQQLWLRVYPDDIHVHSFEDDLTEKEVEAGKTYWLLLLRANRDAEDAETEKQAIWDNMIKKSGAPRSLWITRQTQPVNWKPDLAVADNQLEFPVIKNTKTHDWTRAPRTGLLPDRFVVQIHNAARNNDRPIAPIIGRPLADTVFTGPDPFLAEEAFKKDDKSITLDPSFSWTSDFEQAVKQGLGFKIPLKDEYLNHGQIDRITVMGLMASADPAASAELLSAQISAHRYSSKGFSFLPQGSATNNTAQSGSSYVDNDEDLPLGYFDGSVPSAVAEQADTDARLFADALGIVPAVLDGTRHADKRDIAEARAMNTAVYPATIGHFLEVFSSPAINRNALPKARQFFLDNVTAAGPLPAIRIGDQPYGLVVTSNLKLWHEKDSFSKMLTIILRVLQLKWNGMMRSKVAHVNKSGDASKIMLEILGLSAGSVSYSQRLAHMSDFTLSQPNLSNVSSQLTSKQTQIMGVLNHMGYASSHFPFISNLAFYNKKGFIHPHHLVDRKKPSHTRFLAKPRPFGKNFIQLLATTKKLSDLDKHNLTGIRPPRSVLYFLLRHALLLELQKSALGVYQKQGYAFKADAMEKSLYNFDKEVQDLSSWEILHGVPNKVDINKLKINESIGDHLLKTRPNKSTVVNLNACKKAMTQIAGLSTARLHQCLSDHIDLCSYRLDAWQSGLFQRRLNQNRETVKDGCYIGAYGWVENLKIRTKPTVTAPEALKPEQNKPVYHDPGNAGFVHTPSLNHATAAGVLHAGYNQRASNSKPDSFAVNLSSERVRRGLFLYQGIQNNQPLEALLGYQFERAMHDHTSADPDNNLNQYILAFREKFPIEHASVPQQGTEAQETIPVQTVVNGLKIINAKTTDFSSLGISGPHLAILLKEKNRLADSMDAVADLLTAEAAYQMVQGKTERTAALLNSLKTAELPPELEVNQTPRSTHLSVTNRICLHLSGHDGDATGAGWSNQATPRSSTEPGMNAWLATQIGDPRRIVCEVVLIDEAGTLSNRKLTKLSDLDLQPIDLVYAAGIDVNTGARELEQMVYRQYSKTIDIPRGSQVSLKFSFAGTTARQRNFSQLLPVLRLLRLLISTSHAGSASDFTPQSKTTNTATRDSGSRDAEELSRRTATAISLLERMINTVNVNPPNATQPKTEANPATFRKLFEHYHLHGKPVELMESMHLTDSSITVLTNFLAMAHLFGVQATLPERVDKADQQSVADILTSAAATWSECVNRHVKAINLQALSTTVTETDKQVGLLTDALKTVLGDDFLVLPRFHFSNPDDVRATLREKGKKLLAHISRVQQTTPDLALESWMQSTSPVRENMDHLEQIRLISEFSGGKEMHFTAGQLPYKEQDHWLAVEFPAENAEGERFDILDDTISLCLYGLDEQQVTQPQAVMVVDEWTEMIPNESEITGISYHYDQPDNTAPNAVLLAVEPTGSEKWNWDILTGILDDTLNRSRTRAVEPAHLLEDPALDTLIPMTIASFDLNNSGISLDYLSTDDKLIKAMQRENHELYKNLKL